MTDITLAERKLAEAIAAVYDAASALDEVLAAEPRPDGRAHTALMAARHCILLSSALAGVDVQGVGDWAAHAAVARAQIDAAATGGAR